MVQSSCIKTNYFELEDANMVEIPTKPHSSVYTPDIKFVVNPARQYLTNTTLSRSINVKEKGFLSIFRARRIGSLLFHIDGGSILGGQKSDES